MQPDNGIKTWQWVVTVIVIIVLIVVGVMVFGNKGAQAPATGPEASQSAASPAGNAVNRIVMADQYPGNVAYASSVQLAQPGWVVIQVDNNGQPGAIIGEAYAPAGINPVKVTLSKPILDGGTYYAVLYSDNGDQKFDPNTDLPLKDANGSVVMAVFHGSASAGANLKG